MKRIIFLISIAIVAVGIFLLPKISRAANTDIVINEIGAYQPDNHEWIEIYNKGTVSVDLTGWKFYEDGTNHGLSLYQGDDLIIEPGEYAIIADVAENFIADYQAFSGTVIDSAWSNLNESGELIELRSSINPTDVVESFTYISAPNFSLERADPLLADYSVANWQEHGYANTVGTINSNYRLPNLSPVAVVGPALSATVGEAVNFDGSASTDADGVVVSYHWDFGDGVVGDGVTVIHNYNQENIFTATLTVFDDAGASSSASLLVTVQSTATVTPVTIHPGDLIINEFVSDPPSGAKEWIELYNITTSTLDLTGLALADGVGTIGQLIGELPANGFYVYELSANKLNNAGDIIILSYGSTTIDQVVYGAWDDGNLSDNAPAASRPQAVAKSTDGKFYLTDTPTKSAVNIITTTPPAAATTTPPPPTGSTTASPPVAPKSYQPAALVINEFVSDPADGEVEWLELYNNTNQIINLDDWLITDGANRLTRLTGQIGGGKIVVVEKPKGNLNNSGDLITLLDPAGQIIDQVAYGAWDDGNIFDNALAATDPDAIARLKDGQDTDIDYNDFRLTNTPTKGRPNIINGGQVTTTTAVIDEEAIVEFPSLQLTEILPNPAGSDLAGEFIEIYNPNKEAVDLSGWQLDDAAGGSRPYTLENIIIESEEYLVLSRLITGLALNNDSDSVRLFNPAGELVVEVSYAGLKENQAYALMADGWQITTVTTPGEENIFAANIPVGTAAKTTAQSSSKQPVKISGTVAAAPGVLGAQIFYLHNENIQVYSYYKDFPPLQLGDIVEVSGELSESGGERRIKTKTKDDIKIVGQDAEPAPTELTLAAIGEEWEAALVKVSGEIVEIKGSYLYLDDGSDEAKVYLKSSTGLNARDYQVGDTLTVTGIVSQTAGGYRLLPRQTADLQASRVKGAAEETTPAADRPLIGERYLWAVIVFLAALIVWQVKKQNNILKLLDKTKETT